MYILKNGTLFTMERAPFVGDIQIENGRIAQIGEALTPPPGCTEVDCTGLFVLPGFIDAHCHIGMWEDGMGEEGADGNESTDPITPEMRAIDGLNPFDPCFEEAYKAGVTTAITGPGSANVLGGQFAAVKTYGATLEAMLIKEPVAMKAALGENPKTVYAQQKTAPTTRMAIAALFRKTMVEVAEYERKWRLGQQDEEKLPERDIAMEALLPVLRGELRMKMHAHRADDILTAFRLAQEFGLSISIEHCTEGHLILPELKALTQKTGAGIILGPLLSERSKIELRRLTFRAPALFHEAGIPFALMTDHPVTPLQYLPVCAALCVREGLPEEAALKSITINAARVVGLDSRIGSLCAGKDADIGIFNGHPLDIRAKCVGTFINGQPVYRA